MFGTYSGAGGVFQSFVGGRHVFACVPARDYNGNEKPSPNQG
jgi:hypothetical protein